MTAVTAQTLYKSCSESFVKERPKRKALRRPRKTDIEGADVSDTLRQTVPSTGSQIFPFHRRVCDNWGWSDRVEQFTSCTSTGHVTVCISYTAENISDDISYNACNSRHGAFAAFFEFAPYT